MVRGERMGCVFPTPSKQYVGGFTSPIGPPANVIASNPGLPRPDFISPPWIKSEQGRPGFEATKLISNLSEFHGAHPSLCVRLDP